MYEGLALPHARLLSYLFGLFDWEQEGRSKKSV